MPNRPIVLLAAAVHVGIAAHARAQFSELDKFLASDPVVDDWFGLGVAVDGTTAVVGAPNHNHGGPAVGGAYLFDTTTGSELLELQPVVPGPAGGSFGRSVAIDAGTVVVGAHGNDSIAFDAGTAYVFNASTGTQAFQLFGTDTAADDWFGYSVDVSGNVAIIGAPHDGDNGFYSGSAYLFDVTTGAQLHKLTPAGGVEGDEFGHAVAIHGSLAVVGAHFADNNGMSSGAAYLFDVSTGAEIGILNPTDNGPFDEFGYDVDIGGQSGSELIVIGVPFDDNLFTNAGAAYLFDNTGSELQKLNAGPAEAAGFESFGISVAVNDTVALVGSHWDADNGFASGAAYFFDTGSYAPITKVTPGDGASNDIFGIAVSLNDGAGDSVAVIGAQFDLQAGSQNGSAYLFEAGSTCAADINGDGVLDNGDIFSFVALFVAGDQAADINSDGVLDNGDIFSFVGIFLAGC